MTILDVSIFFITTLSAFFDLKVRRIPNWLMLFGVFLGIAINASDGLFALTQSGLGLFVGVAILIVPFAMGWIGAGDVKMLGVVGSLLGLSWLPRVFFYSALAAGVIAVSYVAVGSAALAGVKELWADVKLSALSLGVIMPDSVSVRVGTNGRGSVPWGVAFAVGTIIAYYFDYDGQWAGF